MFSYVSVVPLFFSDSAVDFFMRSHSCIALVLLFMFDLLLSTLEISNAILTESNVLKWCQCNLLLGGEILNMSVVGGVNDRPMVASVVIATQNMFILSSLGYCKKNMVASYKVFEYKVFKYKHFVII